MSDAPRRPMLAPRRNCWTIAPADEARLLVDGRNYYKAFYEAARQARRYLLIAGWRFNTDVRLLRGRAAEKADGEVELLTFLAELYARNPELRIYLLAWDWSANYALEWEWSQQSKFEEAAPGRIHFRFDGCHAVGGSHHQKFVVIDGQAAFVGGLDFCAGDWDRRAHPAQDDDRADSGNGSHPPYHDLQVYLTGPAALELTAYFGRRWRAAAGRIALGHNHPRTSALPEPEWHVRQLYLDAIDSAEELIYLENQYFSSSLVCQALIDRMKAPGRCRLEVALVLPKQLYSWVEALAMDSPRAVLLDELRQTARDTDHRLGVYYTAAPGGANGAVPILIHSKALVVDDRFLTVGWANTSNRSMGGDTELNVAWEAATAEDGALVRAIRRVRVDLLAEHCGLRRSRAARRGLSRRKGLVALLDRVADGGRHRLRRLTQADLFEDRAWLKRLSDWGFSLDPEQPLLE